MINISVYYCFSILTGGMSVVVGMYFPDSDKIEFNGAKVLWQGT